MPSAAEVFDLMATSITRYRHQAQERYERLDAVVAEMRDDDRRTPDPPSKGAAP